MISGNKEKKSDERRRKNRGFWTCLLGLGLGLPDLDNWIWTTGFRMVDLEWLEDNSDIWKVEE